MGRPIDFVIGKIEDIESDRQAGWEAFYRKDYENEELREEIAKLNKIIRNLRRKKK